MVLDALVGNTDRHHENWGLIVRYEPATQHGPRHVTVRVAPSFDHASSLGRELTDERRAEILKRDRMLAYLRRGHGGIYLATDDPRGCNPLHLVEVASRAHRAYFEPALRAVAAIDPGSFRVVVEQLPRPPVSEAASRFAIEFLETSHRILKGLLQ